VPTDDQWTARLQATIAGLRVCIMNDIKTYQDVEPHVWNQVIALFTRSIIPPPNLVPQLKYVQVFTAGINQVLDKEIYKQDNGIQWATSSGVQALAMAEYDSTKSI
jgi:phosphoglycerate dehydrogenase-like enzyme